MGGPVIGPQVGLHFDDPAAPPGEAVRLDRVPDEERSEEGRGGPEGATGQSLAVKGLRRGRGAAQVAKMSLTSFGNIQPKTNSRDGTIRSRMSVAVSESVKAPWISLMNGNCWPS
jgi:hypothetical protein